MREELRSAFKILSFLLTVVLLNVNFSAVYAQIAITNLDRFEVSFSEDQTNLTQRSVQIHTSDLGNILGSEYDHEVKPWSSRAAGDNTLVVSEQASITALNRLRPAGSPEDVFSDIAFINSTARDFEGMLIAFDFIYQYEDGLSYTLQLNYRVNSNSWKEVSGGVISTEYLQPGDLPWNTFSVQSRIEDMYMKRDDTIQFMWVVTENNSGREHLPLAIQQIEINSVQSTIEPPEPGSVIITEILPSDNENQSLEFIELYNPTDKEIPLKGMEVITSSGQITIQESVSIKPYQYFVLSNEEISSLPANDMNYRFPGSLIHAGMGFVELYAANTEVARATYNITESGRSVELNRMTNAQNGFSGSQNFVFSEQDFERQLNASPGFSGSTNQLYSKTLDRAGWYLISSPGLINERSQQNRFQMYSVNGERLSSDEVSAHAPFLIYREESDRNRIYSEEVMAAPNEGVVVDIDDFTSILSIPIPHQIKLSELTNVSNQPISPVILQWDEVSQNFKLVHDSDAELNHWSSVIVNSEVAAPVQISDHARSSIGTELNRFIRFRYYEEGSNRRERLVDEGLLGFMENQRNRDNRRYDLPKFYPLFNSDDRDASFSLIHLSNPLSNLRTNSFTHLPYELDRDYQLPIGITTNKNGVQGIIEWSAMENIPDEWVLTLEDRRTGLKVDMREETRYRFRHNAQNNIDIEELAETPFNKVTPGGEERFVVTLKPFESALESSGDDTRPGSVELRQNYPNPFNPATNIVYYLPEDTQVRIGIYNVVGQPVAMLVDERMSAGEHIVNWNAAEMPSGIYIIQLETGNRIFTRKITLIK